MDIETKKGWIPGTVVEKIGPLSAKMKLQDGNRDHLHVHGKPETFNNYKADVETAETTSTEQPCHENPKNIFDPFNKENYQNISRTL